MRPYKVLHWQSSWAATSTATTSNFHQTKVSSFCKQVKVSKTAEKAMQSSCLYCIIR